MSVHNTIAKGVFPRPRVLMKKPPASNIRELATHRASAPKGNRDMINTLIELYINRKIVNFTTVETAVTRLASHTKSKPTQEKAVREHDKLVSKYADALPQLDASRGRSSRSARRC